MERPGCDDVVSGPSPTVRPTMPRAITVSHRSAQEIDQLLLQLLHAAQDGMDSAELAVRVGCGAERIRGHLARLEREGHARKRDDALAPRWTAGV